VRGRPNPKGSYGNPTIVMRLTIGAAKSVQTLFAQFRIRFSIMTLTTPHKIGVEPANVLDTIEARRAAFRRTEQGLFHCAIQEFL